jgi:hypothetical protein
MDDLVEDLNNAKVRTVNIMEAFRSADTHTEFLYLPRDTHWTPVGLRLAADAVAETIREMTEIAPPGATGYETQSVTVNRPGDVVQMLKSPLVEHRYTDEEIRCERVISKETGEPYQDSDDSPILVLGDSFLRIYETDEPGSAGFIAHLAKELAMPLSSIVNDGGASTMVRQELSRRAEKLHGKKLIVWEFVERDVRFGTEGWQPVKMALPTNH